MAAASTIKTRPGHRREHSSFTDNQAIGGVGGAGGNGGDGNGGGLFNATVRSQHCHLSHPLLLQRQPGHWRLGGAGGNAGEPGRGGAAINTIGLTVVGTCSRHAQREPQHVHGEQPGHRRYGGPGKVGGTGAGGAIANLGGHNFNATLTVTHSTFTDNRATGGQGGTGADGGVGRGGGIFNSRLRSHRRLGFSTLDLSQRCSRQPGHGRRRGTGARGTAATASAVGGLNLGPAVVYREPLDPCRTGHRRRADGSDGGNGLGGGVYNDAASSLRLERSTVTETTPTAATG